MGKTHHPRRGSMQFWPRKRSRHALVRVRSWAKETKAKPLGFIGYKAGMTQLMVDDNRPKSLTKGQVINLPSTVVECPPMSVFGISFYQNNKKIMSILAEKLTKELGKSIQLPKKKVKKFEDVKEFDDLRLLVHSNPKYTGIGTKKPKLQEVALGGSKDEKVEYAKSVLGKEIKVEEVFDAGNIVDVHGVSKGKGFQGTVKRYGVPIRQHKSEKTKRGIGNLGAWTPKRVDYRVAQPGKMGYHLRTEYNKQVLKVGQDVNEVNPKSGLTSYGMLKSHFLLIRGSVVGARKRAVFLAKAIRPTKKFTKDAPEIVKVIR